MKKDLNDNINNLIIYFEDQKNDKENVDIDEINEFKTIKIRLDHDIENLIKYFENQNNEDFKTIDIDIKKEIENFKTIDIDINKEIEDFKTMNNSLNYDIEKLLYFEDQK
ncbi:unnamed protein product [Rhizophagus irregularis]|uniref:Uncharacterized protein n=1 Tax=Rhizophagus irregularis TaxID=588596 RepID=A0A2I1GL58_9GLOM|nr:hypothetical protein RhiirA4_462502 [Rhizophagus irregularis]CAB4414208.1 unnamed protein product [Rhizophagus irregularis]